MADALAERSPDRPYLGGQLSYEILPLRQVGDDVLRHVPKQIPLAITCTGARGHEATISLAVRLAQEGRRVIPHLAARELLSEHQLEEYLGRLRAAGVRDLFAIAGDRSEPAGCFHDSVELIDHLAEEKPQWNIGVGGYPEGHPKISGAALWSALETKNPRASYVVSQICFNAASIARWTTEVAWRAPGMSVLIGVPGPVRRDKLVRISAALGLGPSAGFLLKQKGLAARMLAPHPFRPDRLVRRVERAVEASQQSPVAGLHVYTFNGIADVERWRRQVLHRTAQA